MHLGPAVNWQRRKAIYIYISVASTATTRPALNFRGMFEDAAVHDDENNTKRWSAHMQGVVLSSHRIFRSFRISSNVTLKDTKTSSYNNGITTKALAKSLP
jgi:hypothetical protein